MDKWERYANSLRLRLAMRVAAQGDLQAEGRTAIKEILEKSVGLSVDRGTRKQHPHCQPEVWATELHCRPRTG